MTNNYDPEKWIWTDADFEQMNWHDHDIYAIEFWPLQYDISFDIDYIFHWFYPEDKPDNFNYWISPATLVFENIRGLTVDIESEFGKLEINKILRGDERIRKESQLGGGPLVRDWTILCQEAEIKFSATGYKQYIRSAPVLTEGQGIPHELRGLPSFRRGRVDIQPS